MVSLISRNWICRSVNTMRESSRTEDVSPRVIGLTAVYSSSLGSGLLLFGLPTSCFEAALMWCCEFGAGRLDLPQYTGFQRRERSTRSNSLLPDSKLPSRFWVEWKGRNLTVMEWEDDFLVSNASRRWITVPLIQWYSHGMPESCKKTAIESTLFQCRFLCPWKSPEG